ncbi:PepSY domain-containing protein [Neisseria wadsworthii]|uniref:Peptidase n=1 Tax=Neisseria wadsworthii 9715 TaxID=1030841 RepID=G4CLY6_9NEIS|nr:PepSY domain-containing protein [Neisseria wadsworthii]EGZ51344.1 peptidase [Neisseria wadsworthii 9715]QMT36161.1 PepSY domain-containing protein [Neisseria wadsworthii]
MFNTTKKLAVATALILATASTGAVAADAYVSPKHAALAQSKISAQQAIDIASKKVKGYAEEVNFEHKNISSYYEVDIIANGQKHEIKIDAANGNILAEKTTPHYNQSAAQPAVSLKQAVTAALAKTGGHAKEADLKHKAGEVFYKVETVNKGQKQYVKVNAKTGAVEAVQPHDHF